MKFKRSVSSRKDKRSFVYNRKAFKVMKTGEELKVSERQIERLR